MSSSDEELETVLNVPTSSRKRARDDVATTSPSKRRPTPVPRSSMAPGSDSVSEPMAGSESESEEAGTNSLLHALMAQLNAMNAATQADRVRVETETRAQHKSFSKSIASVNARVDALLTASQPPPVILNHEPPQPTQAAVAGPLRPPATPSGSSANLQAAPPPQPQTNGPQPPPVKAPHHNLPHSRDNLFPHGQPTFPDVNPSQVEQAREPVKSLRREPSTSDVADQILKVVGILEGGGADKGSKSGKMIMCFGHQMMIRHTTPSLPRSSLPALCQSRRSPSRSCLRLPIC